MPNRDHRHLSRVDYLIDMGGENRRRTGK